MITLYEPAYAKVNLTLDVLCKRADGYHDLQSVMQSISLCDDIYIDVGTELPWSLFCSDADIPCDSRNLAWKAAKVFCDAMRIDPNGLQIRITKRIPSQAGLGGGSSDAAAVLRALNKHFKTSLSSFALAELGALVGSDVPFCVLCGTAMAEGRGERLRRLPNLPACTFVVCKPDFPVSTPELFRKLDQAVISRRPNNAVMENGLNSGSIAEIAKEVFNVFDPVVSADHPEIDHIKAICASCGALAQQMSGSGSAVFAIMPSEKAAQAAYDQLKAHYSQVFIAKPV